MVKRIFAFLLICISFGILVCCNKKSSDIIDSKQAYVGIYDGESGGYLELKSDGTGIYKDAGNIRQSGKAGGLTWYISDYKLRVSPDTLKYEIYADIHNFNGMLYFNSTSGGWSPEKFNKRK